MKRYKKAGDIKVGVVGYSAAFNMGHTQLRDMRHVGMKPTAVAELDPVRLQAARDDFPGIETYASVAEMLEKSSVDLVALITPHNTHAKLALQCLRAGRHVICEKPFAVTTAEVDSMIREAKKRGLMVTAYHNRHWDGNILQAVKMIRKQGVIGDICRVEAHMGHRRMPGDWWRGSKSISGGILYDWGVHLLEYSLQLIDSEMVEVSGYAKTGYWAPLTKWKNDAIEDEGFAVVRFANGAWLTLTMTGIDQNMKPCWIEVTGTEGTYMLNGRDYEIIKEENGKRVSTRGPNPDGQWGRFYRNIANHLVKGEPLVISPEWARRPIHILDLANRSAAQGRALKTKYA